MEEMEGWAINQLSFPLPFYVRYVDDIITAVPKNRIKEVLHVFNNFHERLQFTHEIETEGKISFLDLSLIRTVDEKIITN